MNRYDDALATMDFNLGWERGGIRHTDCRHARRVNFWRDILPPGLLEALQRQPQERSIALDYEPGRVVPKSSPARVYRVRHDQVEARKVDGIQIQPQKGRFYPRGMLHGVPGVFRENIQPFRCTRLDREHLTADFNHPLSDIPLILHVAVHDLRLKFEERGGSSTDWLEAALSGPGIQARSGGEPTDFFSDRPFGRRDENDDAVFYDRPRLVNHLDEAAIGQVARLHERLIAPGWHVLDLMSSWSSHMPETLRLGSLTVLGMNPEELQANRRATKRVIHDLNLNPELPFGDGRFDAVVCTVSVEYLTRPGEVFRQVARALRPGGLFLLTFSNRWFPPKVIRIWPELHEFERMGLVLEYFLDSGQYTGLETFSMQGLPRPEGDKYFGLMPDADPVYAVWGRRAAS